MTKTLVTSFILLLSSLTQAQILDSFDINKTSVMNRHSAPGNFASDGTGLYFFAVDSFCGRELFYFDGTTQPVNITDIRPGTASSVGGTSPQITLLMDNIFFAAEGTQNDLEPWIYNRVNKTVRLLQDLEPGPGMSQPQNFTPFNGKVYFSARTTTHGAELWVYDPNTDTCIRLSDIKPGTLNSNPTYLTAFNNKLYFCADDTGTGTELFEYNPVNDKITLVADIETGKAGSAPSSLTVMGNKLYFWANTLTYGKELHAYNGSTVSRLTDIVPGSGWGNGNLHMAGYKGILYFAGRNVTKNKPEVYKYDPATNQATIAFQLHATVGTDPGWFTVYKDKLYFTATDGVYGNELWQYDGTNTPKRITDIMPGSQFTDMGLLMAAGDGLYFYASAPVIGNELFRYKDTTTPPAAGIQNVAFNAEVAIYPNPTQDVAHLQLKLNSSQALTVAVTDISGRVIFSTGNVLYSAAEHTITIPTYNYASGSYVYSVKDDKGRLMASGKLQKL